MFSRSQRRVFDSVFPPASLKDIAPTPTATPLLGHTSPGQAFGFGFGLQPQTSSGHEHASLTASHGHGSSGVEDGDDGSPEQVVWNRAWHAATSSLSFPDHGFQALMETDLTENGMYERWSPSNLGSREARAAFMYLLSPSSQGRHLRRDSGEDDLLKWYDLEIRRHFLTNFKSGFVMLLEVSGTSKSGDGVLVRLIDYLTFLQKLYFTPCLNLLIPQLDHLQREAAFLNLHQSFHSMVKYSLPFSRIDDLLEAELTNDSLIILGVSMAAKEGLATSSSSQNSNHDGDYSEMEIDRCSTVYRIWKDEASETARSQSMIEEHNSEANEARQRLFPLLQGLQEVGLGGHRAQKIFARVMNDLITRFVKVSYTGQWESPSLAVQHARLWTENVFARLVVQVLHILRPFDGGSRRGSVAAAEITAVVDVSLVDVARWQEIVIARLGALRTMELFDVIVDWDVSRGAIEDLKHYTTNAGTRFYLANSFTATLHRRLLQPSASTVEILQLYISFIKAFDVLDPKGVLVDRIARPIRRYLRDRGDTIKIIVGGLLADADGAEGGQTLSSNEGALTELPSELSKAHEITMKDNRGELDWDDMNWTPDPIDASTDANKKPRGADVIGSLISLFDSKEAFVKELQTALSERLLRNRVNFDQEMSVLELLKIRFGDSTLQACEVMLRDVFDSKRVDAVVRNDQHLDVAEKTTAVQIQADPFVTPDRRNQLLAGKENKQDEMPQLHAKILSRFFWPALQDQSFKVPQEVAKLQQRYSKGFEALKQSRKLTWLNGMGQVTVELDLEDRVFTDEVTTWQATVIHAFQSAEPKTSHGKGGNSSRTPPPRLAEQKKEPVTKSISELSEQLEISPTLARSACLFWVSKQILIEVQRDHFRVLEVLPPTVPTITAIDGSGDGSRGGLGGGREPAGEVDSTSALSIDNSNNNNDETARAGSDAAAATATAAAAAAAAAEAEAEAAAKESADALAMEKMNIYWQFIVGMLTNQGAMPLQRIVMMLKIAVPGGFPFSNEELREFLAGMVLRGKLEILNGGNYKLKRS